MLTDSIPYNILVIEDNPGDFALVEDFLTEQIEFVKISNAKTFKAAKEILSFQNVSIDVILLDLSLPDKTGEALIIEILSLSKSIPVIVLTGYTDFCFGAKSLSLGISDYILKENLTPTIIYKSIVYSLERKKAISALAESETKYSELFHLSPLPMLVFDLETLQFLNVNKSAINHYGYSREEFLSMTIKDLRPTGDFAKTKKFSFISPVENQLFQKETYTHKIKNGNFIQVEIQCNTIKHNGITAMMVMAIDVTEKLNHIKAVEAQNEKLREISWIQSHMVRAPLVRILGLVSLLKDIKDNGIEKDRILNFLEISANDLDQIVREITDKIAIPEDLIFDNLEKLCG